MPTKAGRKNENRRGVSQADRSMSFKLAPERSQRGALKIRRVAAVQKLSTG